MRNTYLVEVPPGGGAPVGPESPPAGRMRFSRRASGPSVVPAEFRPSNGPTLGAAVGPGTSTTLPSGPVMLAPGALPRTRLAHAIWHHRQRAGVRHGSDRDVTCRMLLAADSCEGLAQIRLGTRCITKRAIKNRFHFASQEHLSTRHDAMIVRISQQRFQLAWSDFSVGRV